MTDTQLSAGELKIFDEFYQRRLAEAGGARNDAQELALARDILLAVVNDGLTPTADGGASYVRRGAMDWTDPATVQAAQLATGNGRARTPTTGGQGRDMVQGILVIVLALLAAGWFLWPDGTDETETAEIEVTTLPARATDVTPTPLPTLEAELLADIVDASGVKTELVVPRTLEVKGVSFVVQPVRIVAGDWPLPDDERAVSWVYGTVINYVFGLEATPDTKALLASLEAGDEFLLRMSTGPAYRFALGDTVRVAPQASEIFRQTRPGLTLVLMNDETEASRIVLRGTYIPDSELGLEVSETGETAVLGQRVQLDNTVRLTCLRSDVVPLLDTPSGQIYLRVEYRIENTSGELPLPTSAFGHHIATGGLTYPPVSDVEAPQLNPPLPEILRAGEVFTATAIYAIPAPAGQKLTWVFASAPAGKKLSVELPPARRPVQPQAVVKEASFQDETLLLSMRFEAASAELELLANDIQIEGGSLSPVGNRFPWRVPATSAAEFNLLLSPDGSGQLTVMLLEQGFEITY